jgi:RES domain
LVGDGVILIERGGEQFRVADPQWPDPLDDHYSMRRGGRWNPAGSFPVLYLNGDRAVARANARRMLTGKLEDGPITADDVEPSELPVLVTTRLPNAQYVDIVSLDGCQSVGLPITYPLDANGSIVPWDICQPIGATAFEDGLQGIACRSAADGAPPEGEELAHFGGVGDLPVLSVEAFLDWYGPVDW